MGGEGGSFAVVSKRQNMSDFYFASIPKSEIWKFETSENWRIGKTEIQIIGKSERKGILKNKRITGMSVSCFFTHTSGFSGLLATFIVTDGRVDGRSSKRSFNFFYFEIY